MIIPIPWDGQKINKPGIYAGIPMSAYHGDLCVGPSVSRSGLVTIFSKSPRHYWHGSYLNPKAEPFEATDAMNLGSAAHHLLLGEAEFSRQFVVRPPEFDSWRTKASMEWKKAAEDAGLTVLIPSQIDRIRGMAESLAEEPMIQAGILNGLIEHTIVDQCPRTGIWIKVRPDAIPNDTGDVGDLKTVADIFDEGLDRSIGSTGMNMQAAMVGMMFKRVLKRETTSFNPVFIESKPPHCAQIKTLIEADIELGEQQVEIAIDRFARCVERGVWPGPGGHQSDATFAGLTPWDRKRIERRIEIMKAELEIA